MSTDYISEKALRSILYEEGKQGWKEGPNWKFPKVIEKEKNDAKNKQYQSRRKA
jgi:hypothetical protein